MKKLILSLLFCSGIAIAAFAQESVYTPQLPKEAFKHKKSKLKTLPDPQFRIATTTIHLHPTGLKEGSKFEAPMLYTTNPFTGEYLQIEPKETEKGKLTYEFEQYVSGTYGFILGREMLRIASHPGETIDIWFDVNAYRIRSERKNQDNADAVPADIPYVYFTGELADLNNGYAHSPHAFNMFGGYYMLTNETEILTSGSAETLIKEVVKKIKSMSESIMADKNTPDALKEYGIVRLRMAGIRAIREMQRSFSAIGYNGRVKPPVKIEEHTDKLYLMKVLDLNDPKLVYGGEDFSFTMLHLATIIAQGGVTEQVVDTPSGWMQYGATVFPILKKVTSMETVTAEDEAVIAGSTPYYRELYSFLKQKTDKQYNEAMASGSFVIRETPEYENVEELLERIVAQYKGKVVFVDFWATWCGPCMAGMRTIRPFKPEMKAHDVISVYITNESSPKAKWTLALPDIGGEHYYLTSEENRAMSKKYGYSGIPTYMIFDKEGEKVFQQSGFPGIEKLRKEFEKVW